MAKKKRLSRDQQRKAKLSERARKAHLPPSQSELAYTGNRYKRDELIPVFFHTETAIYEVFVMTDREITDHTVRSALEKLVLQLRAGPLPDRETDEVSYARGQEGDLLIQSIRRRWDELFQDEPHPGTENLIGVLRTMLGSVNIWSTPSPSSRGYLHYIEGFLSKAGVKVRKVSARTMQEELEPEDPFLELGHAWCEGNRGARAEFLAQAEALIASGQWQRVVNVAQRLIGEVGDRDPMSELSALSITAQQIGRRSPG
jgi:hypothetical protein